MDTSTRARAALAPKPFAAKKLIRWAYTSNPFYVLSADLVFVGLRLSFDTSGKTFETGALMVSLLGYTLLMATTACLLIRIGKVWDDVRTMLLLVVAMFLAISVTFDETLAASPRLGTLLYLGGLAFAVVVSEALLWGIQLRLPPLFRLPYYLVLALFFLYPVALTPFLRDPDGRAIQWLLFGFSPLAGLAFLALLPAVRRGPGYVAKNGSPWKYPLYPWTLFGLLGAAICGRAYYLCISFHFVERSEFVGKSDSIFGPYFLVPFLLAVVVLLLQAGLTSRNLAMQKAAMILLPGLVVAAMVGHRPDPIFRGFLGLFIEGMGGSPLFLTLLAVTVLYAGAALRRVPLALGGLTASLLALAMVGPTTLDLNGLVAPQPLPILAVAGLQIGVAVWRRESWRSLAGAVCLMAAMVAELHRGGLSRYDALAAYHMALAAAILIGALFDDTLARLLRTAAAAFLGLSCVVTAWGGFELFGGISPEWLQVYSLAVIFACAGIGSISGAHAYLVAASVGAAAWLTGVGWWTYQDLRRVIVGLDWIAAGLAFFALAAIISLGKAGLWSNGREGRASQTSDPPLGCAE